jgi:hypothetical protein
LASNAGGAVPTLAALCIPKLADGCNFDPCAIGDWSYQQLSHPVAPLYLKRSLAVVNKQDLDFVPIIRIYGAGGIQNCGTVL